MGTKLSGECTCGYQCDVFIGSARAQHGINFYFPHYCSACNSLTSVDMLSDDHACEKCGSKEIYSYDAPTKATSLEVMNALPSSLLKRLGYHKANDVCESAFCYPIDKTFNLLSSKQHCPRCKQVQLTFNIRMMYD